MQSTIQKIIDDLKELQRTSPQDYSCGIERAIAYIENNDFVGIETKTTEKQFLDFFNAGVDANEENGLNFEQFYIKYLLNK